MQNNETIHCATCGRRIDDDTNEFCLCGKISADAEFVYYDETDLDHFIEAVLQIRKIA